MSRTRLTASALATQLGGELSGDDTEIVGLAPLGEAKSGQLTFAVDPVRYADALSAALEAGAIVLVPGEPRIPEPPTGTLILVDIPRAAFAKAMALHFAPRPQAGVHPSAVIHETATVDPTAYVGPFSVIGAGAVIGADTEIRAHVVIGRDVVLGSRCLIKSNAVIGEEGFGVEKDVDGTNVRLPHLGSVRIGDDVEVGNFTTVCSGTLSPTTIQDHTKIDDHVHIAHNCQIGSNVIITACAEISGSVTVENDVWVGPNSAVLQGVTLGEHSLLGIGAVAIRSVPADEVHTGNPARRLRANPR